MRAVRDLARHELEPAAGRLVIEEDSADREEAVRLAVVDGDEMAVRLRHSVGRARIEGGALVLRHLAHLPEHLRGGGLVEARLGRCVPHRLEHLGHAQRGELPGQHRLVPAGRHERLRGQVVDLVGLHVAEQPGQRELIEQVALVQLDPALQVGDALELLLRGAAHHAVDLVALRQQELREVAAVLPGDPGDERASGHGEVREY